MALRRIRIATRPGMVAGTLRATEGPNRLLKRYRHSSDAIKRRSHSWTSLIRVAVTQRRVSRTPDGWPVRKRPNDLRTLALPVQKEHLDLGAQSIQSREELRVMSILWIGALAQRFDPDRLRNRILDERWISLQLPDLRDDLLPASLDTVQVRVIEKDCATLGDVKRKGFALLDDLDHRFAHHMTDGQLIEDIGVEAGQVCYHQIILEKMVDNLLPDHSRSRLDVGSQRGIPTLLYSRLDDMPKHLVGTNANDTAVLTERGNDKTRFSRSLFLLFHLGAPCSCVRAGSILAV